ncbi:PKD domain-containing protein [Aliiglaciecola lipolytica]|uniref:PKD/Chitinase domain-containing protein n=1 Tax=Aliiglaciecola lipolytica E3 TaxID=1127673 RepID=K6XQB4_9ALTE|nr:PKD domain-containing protein [Aliiglaciecola lipolytica]GAC13861.1 hypothetical protein GLIP_1220 [Aliiglaciecola lipolytica E3]
MNKNLYVTNVRAFKKLALTTCIATMLSACGNSNSDETSPPPTPTNQPPTADAGADFEINEGLNASLSGSGSDSDGTISTYLWTQTSGPTLTLSSTTDAAPSFNAPTVDADTLVEFDLTVTDDDGATATDSVVITIKDVASVNTPPVAKAGEDAQAEVGETVALDGSASSDLNGTISSYQWTQVNNGSVMLPISDSDTATATIKIPELSENTEFEFSLTVTDNDGASASDSIIILGRPAPFIEVGKVIGNTANVNSLAQFSVTVGSQPISNLTINVTSSDPSEGMPEESSLTFTPDNWEVPQTVNVYGQNPNVVDGEQNYQIILSEVTSSDPFYNGLNPNDVTLKGIELEVVVPEQGFSALPNVPFSYLVEPTYTGNNPLTYAINNAPEGMSIDFNNGLLSWVPASNIASGDSTFDVTVNDGSRFSTATVAISVAETASLATSYEQSTSQLTITEDNSNLNGVQLSQVELLDALATLTLSSVDRADIPNQPSGVIALTDGLIVNEAVDAEIDIRFSLSDLPSGVEIDDVRYYTYSEISDSVEHVWSVGGYNRQFSGTEEAPFVAFRFAQLPALGFFGYVAPSSGKTSANAQQATSASYLVDAATAAEVTCTQQTFFGFSIDEFECTSVADPAVTITVDDWGDDLLRWNSVSKEQVVSWIVDARAEFTLQNLGFDDEFTVRIETMDDARTLGFVNSREDYKVLHITDLNSKAATTIQGTSVHEYYHHAQGHPDTKLENQSLVIQGGVGIAWLYEGTARWVEDVIFDNINTYKAKERLGKRILEVGLKTGIGENRNRPYQRFSFFKLLDQKCPAFNTTMQEVFNFTPASDPLALKNLNGLLNGMGCDFGDHFGANNSASLASALSFYNVATQLNNSISSLDSNETNIVFPFEKPNYRFSPNLSSTVADLLAQPDNTIYTLQNVAQIKSAGAVSFEVPAFTGTMPEGKVAELLIESTSQVYVSIASNDAGFQSTNTIDGVPHTWFSSSLQSSYVYGEGLTNLPKLFVTLVNSDEDADATVKVSFKVRDELNVDTIITSHQSGEDVSDRVISISGNIPDEGQDATTDVHITANGITTIVPMSSSGSFEGSVVMSLGANNVKAQGFNGSSPTTREEIITLNGVAAGSTGVNALIASRVVFVLRWDTATDIDIYSKDPLAETIWYSDRTATLGNLDRDDTSGYGPEVVSYRADGNTAYSNGQFDVDVHYYSGSPSTNYTIDVILNETEGANRRNYQFNSTTPLTVSSSSEAGVDDTGTSRFNDILFISCNAARVCGLNGYDSSKLSLSSGLGNGAKPESTSRKVTKSAFSTENCETAKARVSAKYGITPQSCNDEKLK